VLQRHHDGSHFARVEVDTELSGRLAGANDLLQRLHERVVDGFDAGLDRRAVPLNSSKTMRRRGIRQLEVEVQTQGLTFDPLMAGSADLIAPGISSLAPFSLGPF
jgi:hypothetical protein